MAYLAQQETTAHVVGVEGIRKALEEFVQEHSDLNITPTLDNDTADDKNDSSSNRNSSGTMTTTMMITDRTFERFSGDKISLLVSRFLFM